MSFVKNKASYKTALIIFINYGEEYRHIADLFMRKAYGR